MEESKIDSKIIATISIPPQIIENPAAEKIYQIKTTQKMTVLLKIPSKTFINLLTGLLQHRLYFQIQSLSSEPAKSSSITKKSIDTSAPARGNFLKKPKLDTTLPAEESKNIGKNDEISDESYEESKEIGETPLNPDVNLIQILSN